ncbi:LysR family transcriptional regulator [Micromonospora siamensis]|uniref:DNA-binding transcriptional regulator, LysR family n=1 Tax=Micromonospora siamensis TaxID=299152 RepID=A0A1C5HXC1_9ACTN|nr:LysR family transcriptional regulator [Micromonospora siamensis]SCG50629.1 DNA-binding transcriptional regulator, LysR family [Micromonospora siamensis]
MDTVDLRLVLGVADGDDVLSLATRLGLSETAVRKRLRRLVGVPGTRWLYRTGPRYRLTDRGQAALGTIGETAAALAAIGTLVGVDVLPVRHVRVVTEVLARGSIGCAARHLGLPQPSVSAQVTRLERRWGSALFHRAAGGVSATPALVELLPHLRVLERALARLAETGMPDDDPSVPCDLEVASEFGFTGLLDALRDEALVDVRQHIVSIPGPDWVPEMVAADICVYADLPLASLTTPPGWDTTLAFDEPAYALVPPGADTGRTSIGLRELAGHDWLTGPVGTRNHRSILAVCRAAGFAPRIRHTALNGPSGRHILEEGGAVALTGATLVPPGASRAVRLAEDVRVKVVVGWQRGGPATATARWIARWLRDQHIQRLAERRPELLAELRGDPVAWPCHAAPGPTPRRQA